MATIAELLTKIKVQVTGADKAEKELAGVAKETEEVGKKAGKSKRSIKEMAVGLGKTLAKGAAIAAAAIAAATVAIFKFVSEQTAAIDTTNKLAKALGLPVDELQRLQFAAERSGVEAEKLKAGILKVNAAVLDLKNGSGAAVEPLKDLGIGLEDLEGLTTTDQIGLIGERLQELGSDAERSALSARIFGEEAGPAMASLLAEGREGLAALGAQAKNVLTPEDANRASDFQDKLTNLTDTVESFVAKLAIDLLPPITEVIEGIQNWANQNQELIGGGLDVFLTVLSELWSAVSNELKILVAIVKTVIGFFAKLLGKVKGASTVFRVLIRVVTALFNPLNTLIDIVKTVILGLEKMGVVSDGTADRFRQSVDNMVASAAGFDTIAAKAGNATDEISDLQGELFQLQIAQGPQPGGGVLPTEGVFSAVGSEADQQRRAREAAREARREKAAGGAPRGGGGGSKPKKPKAKKPKGPPPPTVDEIVRNLLAGRGDTLRERLKNFKQPESAIKDQKPTVAMFIFDVTQNITSPNPIEAGTVSAQKIKEVFRMKTAVAAQALASNLVR